MEDANEGSFLAFVEGRIGPGFNGVCIAVGSDRFGRYCNDEYVGRRDRESVQPGSDEPDQHYRHLKGEVYEGSFPPIMEGRSRAGLNRIRAAAGIDFLVGHCNDGQNRGIGREGFHAISHQPNQQHHLILSGLPEEECR